MTNELELAVRSEAAVRGMMLEDVEVTDLASGAVVERYTNARDEEGEVTRVDFVELGAFLGVLRVELRGAGSGFAAA